MYLKASQNYDKARLRVNRQTNKRLGVQISGTTTPVISERDVSFGATDGWGYLYGALVGLQRNER